MDITSVNNGNHVTHLKLTAFGVAKEVSKMRTRYYITARV